MSFPANTIALKVDVDTRRGLERGVPRLLEMFRRHEVKATFYMSWGPDRSGRALLKLFTNPRFFLKMLRTGAPGTYGIATALYGVLLPSPLIGLGKPDIVKQALTDGHEVEMHAWDHRTWQDTLTRRDTAWIADWFEHAINAHRHVCGKEPQSFGAPAWTLSPKTVNYLAKSCFQYLSCTRAKEPFVLEGAGMVELPGSLPCFEETGGYDEILNRTLADGKGVLTLHAEIEGGRYAGAFEEQLLVPLKQSGLALITMGNLFGAIDRKSLITRKYATELLPGRAFVCSV